ncbi:MAG: cation diffusion facilitator family transporter [candidate division Zixibacteria bacterium]|nr:cation diffusion facilitator family transporter [candidate division Zixibacteria bacterium]
MRISSRSPRVKIMQKVTAWGLVANLGLAAIKFFAGTLGHSNALVADAVHSLTDTSTDIAVLIGAPRWSAPADESHPHGHGRIETLITVFIGLVLIAAAVGLGFKAISDLQTAPDKSPGWIAFWAACASIIIKELLYRWNAHVGRRVKSSAIIANAWHHRSDALSSVPVVVALLGTRIQPAWTFLDHLGAIIVSLFILQAAWKIFWPALKQLSDTGASKEEIEELYNMIRYVDGVRDAHALRTRNIGPGLQVDLHLQVDPELSVRDGHTLAGVAKSRLLEHKNVVDVLIHIEPFEDEESK